MVADASASPRTLSVALIHSSLSLHDSRDEEYASLMRCDHLVGRLRAWICRQAYVSVQGCAVFVLALTAGCSVDDKISALPDGPPTIGTAEGGAAGSGGIIHLPEPRTTDGGPCPPFDCGTGATKYCGDFGDACGQLQHCGDCPTGLQCKNNVCAVTTCLTSCSVPGGDYCGTVGDGCGGTLVCPTGCPTVGWVCEDSLCKGPASCVPVVCNNGTPFNYCGDVGDGCGGTLHCGSDCDADQMCGADGICKGAASCVPIACANGTLFSYCGDIGDGCGGKLSCGTLCAPNQICGADGLCKGDATCVPTTCENGTAYSYCGTVGDGCGGALSCPTNCGTGKICDTKNGLCKGDSTCVPNAACTNGTAYNYCGDVGDGCGGTLHCGSDCGVGQVCDATTGLCKGDAPQNIETMRIAPADSTISVQRGQSATVAFRTFAKMKGDPTEVEITNRTVFYVPDNYLVGSFPADGSSTFTTRLPVAATDPPQRGGLVTIQAQAANSQDPITTVTTTLTVKIVDTIQPTAGSPAATPALPADPGSLFQGTSDPTLAPTLVYPNDGVLLPPNLGILEVHFMPGAQTNELYEISLQSAFSDLRFYTRCYADTTVFLSGSCVQQLDASTVDILAESNRGGPAVTLSVLGANGNGSFAQSAQASIQFASDRVDGAVYYWTTSNPPRIMRFDFGSQSGLAPVLQPSDLPSDSGTPGGGTRCVGCHSLSAGGGRMAAASGTSYESYLVYLNDLTLPRTATSNWLTVDGRNNGPASQNRVLITSFNPDGSEFVAVPPNGDGTATPNSLLFHDGATGLRKTTSDGTLSLAFTPAFPAWSPDGGSISVTHIYGSNKSTIEFQEGGISVITQGTTGWNLPPIEIVPHVVGKNRYNATFVPDASFLLYSESIRQAGDSDAAVNAYSDPSAKTWAVTPIAGAQAVSLDRSNAVGVADTLTLADGRDSSLQQKLASDQLMNTFARAAPFASKQDGHKLFWFTASSQRRAGVRRYYPNASVVGDPSTQTLLWMFALDADNVLAGKDGSYPGFFLPFQDMTTSNHMATWTQKYVSDQPPPAPPPVVPPPAPPPAPTPPPPPSAAPPPPPPGSAPPPIVPAAPPPPAPPPPVPPATPPPPPPIGR